MGITNIYPQVQGFVDTKTHIKGFGGYKHMCPRLKKTNTHINGLGDTNKHIQGLVDTNTRILCLDDISKYTGLGIQTHISNVLGYKHTYPRLWPWIQTHTYPRFAGTNTHIEGLGDESYVPMAVGYKHSYLRSWE